MNQWYQHLVMSQSQVQLISVNEALYGVFQIRVKCVHQTIIKCLLKHVHLQL